MELICTSPLHLRLFTSYFVENIGYLFFTQTVEGPGLTVQAFYATDGPLPVIVAKDIGKFALIAFKNPEKYIGKPLKCFPIPFYQRFWLPRYQEGGSTPFWM